ncbi:MAG: ABC transporter permease [Alphaproteobacteria bacterium]
MADQTSVNRAGVLAADDAQPAQRLPGWASKTVFGFGLLTESYPAMIGVGLIVFWVLVAIFAGVLAPYSPTESFPGALATTGFSPTPEHWLGLDNLFRDSLSRVLYGARTVLFVTPLAVGTAFIIGCTLGLTSGYYGGWIDDIIQRISDVILAFPLLILYVILISTYGASIQNIVIAIGLGASPGIGRITRGLVLDIREQEYVKAAQIRGESSFFIMLIELLPNARGPLIVDMCLRFGYAIITIGGLGFLGLGLPPPNPDWGSMVSKSINFIPVSPEMAIFPSIAISSLIVGFNLLADGLREIAHRD